MFDNSYCLETNFLRSSVTHDPLIYQMGLGDSNKCRVWDMVTQNNDKAFSLPQ